MTPVSSSRSIRLHEREPFPPQRVLRDARQALCQLHSRCLHDAPIGRALGNPSSQQVAVVLAQSVRRALQAASDR